MADSNNQVIYLAVMTVNSISILSCCLIIMIYIFAKDLRVYAFTLVCYLSIIDIFKSASMLLPTYHYGSDSILCKIQGFSLQYFTLASFVMTTLMAVALYLCVVLHNEKLESLRFYFFGILLIVPLCGSVPPLLYDVYGKSPTWCSLQNSQIWRFSSFYGPLWLINVVNFILYLKVIKALSGEVPSTIKRLRFYPMILIICYTPATVDRVLEVYGYGPYFYLTLSAGLGDAVLGLINALCYGYTDHVRQFLILSLCYKKKLSTHELLDL